MKARNYRKVKGVPYTRSKYIHGAPQSKIVKFTMGQPSDNFNIQVSLLSQRRVQIRHNALEAARVAVNRHLQEKLGESFFVRVLPLPHVVLRENKMIFGAHADRLQDGMRKAFGKPMGKAARVDPDQPIIIAYVAENGVEAAKEAMKRGEAKLPMPCKVTVIKLVKKVSEVQIVAS
jgi:large subunit ribosomal protein L10e